MNIELLNKKKYSELSAGFTSDREIFHVCTWLYLIAFFILPDGLGFRLGFLFSAKRIMMFVCYGFIIFSNYRLNMMFEIIKKLKVPNIIIILYMFVRTYTALYRMDINTFAGEFLDGVMVFYLFSYILTYEISTKDFLKFIRITLLILCLEGIFEYITHINLFSFLITDKLGLSAGVVYRNGENRVVANCHHAIHYGIYISLLFFLSCYDYVKKRLYLFNKPILFILSCVCVFMSGSRAPLGIFLFGLVLIVIFSNKIDRITSALILLGVVILFALFTVAVYNTSLVRQIMYMLTAMIDAIFRTEYALKYSDTVLKWSTEYRDALKKVFELDYFNKIVGRGASYGLSVVIDGYWLQSCDNSYVVTYIQLAYPGLAMIITQLLTIITYSIKGLKKYKDGLFAAILVCIVIYIINIWYVACMGTFMYIWMLFALLMITYLKKGKKDEQWID